MKSIVNHLANLLTFLVVSVCIINFIFDMRHDLNHTGEWDQSWRPKPNVYCEHSADQITKAIQQNSEAYDFITARKFIDELNNYYEPIPGTVVRLTLSELLESLKLTFMILSLIILPIVINYVNNGRFSVWNRELVSAGRQYVIHRHNAPRKAIQPVDYTPPNSVASTRIPDSTVGGTKTRPSNYAKASFYCGLIGLIFPPLFLIGVICAFISLSKGERSWRIWVGLSIPLSMALLRVATK